jgi:fumarate hydratase, class II
MSSAPQTRTEHDSFGPIQVPRDRLWGAQTQRSLEYFAISNETMPSRLIWALAMVKREAARTNLELAELEAERGRAIMQAADEVIAGRWDTEFPLSVWQTGSGTQTNMNMNEVLANRASELLGGTRGMKRLVHPNDDVNRGQSSNDVFPAAMALAACFELTSGVLPELEALHAAFIAKATAYEHLVKVGRTHLQDATPLTLGQEIGAWAAQIEHGSRHLRATLPHLFEVALGATAVGTGLNAAPGYAEKVASHLAAALQLPLVTAPNKFEAIAAHDALVASHGALKTVAASLMKIANDVRWLASGPRCGLGELQIPENEPGSSIMPGKVNPTQCEALTMCCAQVFGNDVTINIAGASGSFQLNAFKPVLIYNFLQSARVIAGGCASFRRHLVDGLTANESRIADLLNRSLMLVTALSPTVGYDAAARIAKKAHAEGTTLREASLALGLVSAEEFDRIVRPETMV